MKWLWLSLYFALGGSPHYKIGDCVHHYSEMFQEDIQMKIITIHNQYYDLKFIHDGHLSHSGVTWPQPFQELETFYTKTECPKEEE